MKTMAKYIDIIDVKQAVCCGELKIVIQNGFSFLENTKSGERVLLNKVDVVPVVHGRWERHTNASVQCSVCGGVVLMRFKFCPNCGAKMDER